MGKFKVGLSRDFLNADGALTFGADGIDYLNGFAHIEHRFFPEHLNPVDASQLAGLHAVISLTPRYTRQSLAQADELLVLARYGVGYDNVDVQACTDAGVALVITPTGVRKPVAYSILTLMLALAHNLPVKSKLIRERRWDDRTAYPGTAITGQTLGSIGLGNIAREMFRLTQPFDMRRIAYDPFLPADKAQELGVELVSLETLCRESDFLAVNCFLSKETYHLISDEALGRMKPNAYLINTARGGIVDEAALIRALQAGTIAGAGLDVFEQEPFVADSPLHHMDNVILTPHSLCWTDELYRGLWKETTESVVRFSRGQPTDNVVNKEVLRHPDFIRKLQAAAR